MKKIYVTPEMETIELMTKCAMLNLASKLDKYADPTDEVDDENDIL